MPRIRERPEDFEVEEVAFFEPSGEGDHAYLWIEKRLRNSQEIVHQLVAATGCEPWQIGYAGRKDRRAVTRQWFSVPGLDLDAACALELEDARVLRAERHKHKLRTGMHSGNRFRIRVRDVDARRARHARERLAEVVETGMPNRFGRQRFGSDGGNVRLGLGVLTGERQQGQKRKQWLMVSAIQSAVFNRVLELRPAPVDQVLAGEVAIEHSTGWEFWVEDLERERARAERFQISAAGPLFGFKVRRPHGVMAEVERRAQADLGVPPLSELSLPKGLRLPGERRPLRARVSLGEAEYLAAEKILDLHFELPPGSYATVLLEELFPDGYREEPSNPIEQVFPEEVTHAEPETSGTGGDPAATG